MEVWAHDWEGKWRNLRLLRLCLRYPPWLCILTAGCSIVSAVESAQRARTVMRLGIQGSGDIVALILDNNDVYIGDTCVDLPKRMVQFGAVSTASRFRTFGTPMKTFMACLYLEPERKGVIRTVIGHLVRNGSLITEMYILRKIMII